MSTPVINFGLYFFPRSGYSARLTGEPGADRVTLLTLHRRALCKRKYVEDFSVLVSISDTFTLEGTTSIRCPEEPGHCLVCGGDHWTATHREES